MILESLDRIDITKITISTGGGASSPPLSRPTLLLEALSRLTWERIKYSVEYNVSQGEETITDINLLGIAMAGVKEIDLWKCPKDDEGRTGVDWEWLIGSHTMGWLRYAVQAKKIDPESGQYLKLNYKVGPPKKKLPQIEILKRHARWREAIPLYCFYNHVEEKDYRPYWHCNLDVDAPQLGCSVVPLRVIEEAKAKRAKKGQPSRKSFWHLHSSPHALPWRCLVRCGHVRRLYEGEDEFDDEGVGRVRVHRLLPPDIADLFRGDDISNVRYDPQAEIIPKRVAVINIGHERPPEVQGETFKKDIYPLPAVRKF